MENNFEALQEMISSFGNNELRKQRVITISEGIDSRVSKRVCQQLLTLEGDAPGEPIFIYQNSPGGEVNSGFAIFVALSGLAYAGSYEHGR